MKLHKNTNPVERIGETGQESEFTITSSPQAFEILSSGIYTDPIMAVIRELSCNAYDAMVDAGKPDSPFRVHLPNKLEPYFSVSDDGIGLSDKDVRGLYSSYFQSTKSDDNTKIGAFGLGSKSPFSYSKAFDVISRFDGVKRIYTVFINEDGIPAITDGATIDTDECNGIEVKIAVRSQDYDTFAYSTAEILRFFPVKPTVLGRSEFKFPEPSESSTVTDTYIVDKENSGLIAVQGNVPYKVTQHQLANSLSSAATRFMNNHMIVLFFDIGMIDIAASREEVRYDEQSVQNMANALQVAFDDYLVKLDEQLTELTKTGSVWEVYLTLRNKFGSKSNLESLVGKNFKFESDMANKWMEDDKLEYNTDWQYHKIIPYKKGEARAQRGHHDFEGYGQDRTYHIRPEAGTQVVIQDVTKRGSMRMNTKLVSSWSSGIKTIMAIVPVTDRMLTNLGKTATSQERATELDLILEQFGNPETKLVSTWTEDVAQEVRAARTSGHSFKTFDAPSFSRSTRAVKPTFSEVAEPDDGGLYIEIDLLRNIMIDGNKHNINNKDLRDMLVPVLNVINLAQGTDYAPENVFGLTKKVVKHVSTNDDWSSVVDAYKEAIQDQKDIIEYYERIENSTSLGMGYALNKNRFVKMVDRLDTNSNFKSIMEPIIEAAKEANKLSNHSDHPVTKEDFRGELRNFEMRFKIEHDVKDDAFFTDKDLADYSMLRHIDFNYEGEVKDAKKYIQLVEA